MKPSNSSIPDTESRLHAAWGLVLPYAKHVLVVASQPPTGLIDWWRRHAVVVSVARPGESHEGSPDLVLLWGLTHNALQEELRALPKRGCCEVAVWNAATGALRGLRFGLEEILLRSDHWSRTARFYAWPDRQRPRQIIEHDRWTRTPLHVHRRSQKLWKGTLLQSSLGRLLAPASLSRWQRRAETPTPSWLSRIVLQASERLGESLVAVDSRLSPNGVAIVRLQNEASAQPVGILKIPLVEKTVPRVATNARALEWMQSQRQSLGNWSDAAPSLLAAEETNGCPWSLEEHVVGSEAQTWQSAPATQATKHLAELLGLYQRASTATMGISELQERLQPQVDAAGALLSDDLAQGLQEIWRNTVRTLAAVPIPIVPQHGDCKLENVLGDPQCPNQLRLLDWELWKPDGLPLLDLLHLLLSRRRRHGGYSIGGSICRWLVPGDFAPWERSLIDSLAQGLDRRYVRATAVLYWLERIGPIAERGSWPHDGWAQANVAQVIERLKQRQAEVLA